MNTKTASFLIISCFASSIAASGARMIPRVPTAMRLAEQVQSQAVLQQRSMARGQQHDFEQVRSNKWQYWSMGLGAGAGMLYFGDLDGSVKRIPFPDFRINIERSWYLTDQFTAMVDISLLTPALRLGYIVDEHTRLFCGMGLWLLGSYGLKFLFSQIDKTRMVGGNMAMKDAHDFKVKSHLTVTPSVGLDHFLSKNCFLRVAASYDQVLLAIDKARTFTLHWPQLSASLNFRF